MGKEGSPSNCDIQRQRTTDAYVEEKRLGGGGRDKEKREGVSSGTIIRGEERGRPAFFSSIEERASGRHGGGSLSYTRMEKGFARKILLKEGSFCVDTSVTYPLDLNIGARPIGKVSGSKR